MQPRQRWRVKVCALPPMAGGASEPQGRVGALGFEEWVHARGSGRVIGPIQGQDKGHPAGAGE